MQTSWLRLIIEGMFEPPDHIPQKRNAAPYTRLAVQARSGNLH